MSLIQYINNSDQTKVVFDKKAARLPFVFLGKIAITYNAGSYFFKYKIDIQLVK